MSIDPIEHRVGENVDNGGDKIQISFNISSQAFPGPILDNS